jgi:PIH1 CS-like domain
MSLDIGEDRILLTTRSNVYHLDIYLPYSLVQEECFAQFNRKTKVSFRYYYLFIVNGNLQEAMMSVIFKMCILA